MFSCVPLDVLIESHVVQKWLGMCRSVLGLFGAWFALVPILYTVSFYMTEKMDLINDSLCEGNSYRGCLDKWAFWVGYESIWCLQKIPITSWRSPWLRLPQYLVLTFLVLVAFLILSIFLWVAKLLRPRNSFLPCAPYFLSLVAYCSRVKWIHKLLADRLELEVFVQHFVL